MLKVFGTLLLSLLATSVSGDAAIRPDYLIFNQTYPLVSGSVTTLPFYVTRRGDYYAEAILERAHGQQRADAVAIDLKVQIDRDEKPLLTRALTTELGRERPIATLFWFTTDREVPIKTPLTLALAIGDVAQSNSGEVVRIQVKRKLNRPRLF